MIEIRIMGNSEEIRNAINSIGKSYRFIEVSKLYSTRNGNKSCYIRAEEKKLREPKERGYM